MQIYIGADHNGFYLKDKLKDYLTRNGYDVHDEGDKTLVPADDFPVFAKKVVRAVLGSKDKDARGILICGSGQGMCMAANRFKGIRASMGWDTGSVRSTRNDEDSNVLCLPARVLDKDTSFNLVDLWLSTPFADADRYKRRNKELDELG